MTRTDAAKPKTFAVSWKVFETFTQETKGLKSRNTHMGALDHFPQDHPPALMLRQIPTSAPSLTHEGHPV